MTNPETVDGPIPEDKTPESIILQPEEWPSLNLKTPLRIERSPTVTDSELRTILEQLPTVLDHEENK